MCLKTHSAFSQWKTAKYSSTPSVRQMRKNIRSAKNKNTIVAVDKMLHKNIERNNDENTLEDGELRRQLVFNKDVNNFELTIIILCSSNISVSNHREKLNMYTYAVFFM